MLTLFLYLFLAHIISDFYLQSDSFCTIKNSKSFCCWQLYVHALIVFITTMICVPAPGMWIGACVIAATHLVFDGLKKYLSSCRYYFAIDQILHVMVLICVSYLLSDASIYWNIWISNNALMVIFGLLLCMKPANIWIKQLFYMANINVPSEPNISQKIEGPKDLPNAGHLIGSTERIIAFVLVLIGQYEVLGFLIAAKSLLRFRDTDTEKTEYLLVGTLLSFGIAIIMGVLFHVVKCYV